MRLGFSRYLVLVGILTWAVGDVYAAKSVDVSSAADQGSREVKIRRSTTVRPQPNNPVMESPNTEVNNRYQYSRRKKGYIGLALGGSSIKVKKKPHMYENKVKKKFMFGFFGGFHFNDYYRLELGLNSLGEIDQIYKVNDASYLHGPTNLMTYLVNTYFSYPCLKGRLFPFLGLGVGMFEISGDGKKKGENKVYKYRSKSFAWQIMAGADYALPKGFELGLEIRHLRPSAKFSSDYDDGRKIKTTVNITSFALTGKFNFR